MAYQKVLITVDSSMNSSKVAEYGVKLASELGADIAVVFVADIEKANMNYETGRISQSRINNLKKEGNAIIDRVALEYPNINFERFISEGIPSKEILNISDIWQADLIVMGTHGKTGLTRLLMGSTAENTLRSSSTPILIVPCKFLKPYL
jgi:nucleotide-binding universal stress UspA family protein